MAVVTGASRGIGASVARLASARGASVGLIARSADELEALVVELGGRGEPGGPGGPDGPGVSGGPRVAAAVADVGERAQLEAALDELAAKLGPVDVLVNNAGIGAYGPFAEVDVAEVERLMRVNYLGTVYGTRHVLPGMIERRRGHIVTIGSIAGRLGAPFEAAYSASKFAQVGLTEALAIELSAFGIGVSMVNPGPVATHFFDARGHAYARRVPRPVPPERVARAVIAVVEGKRLERIVPRWLGQALVTRHVAPRLYGSGTRRSFRRELADWAARR